MFTRSQKASVKMSEVTMTGSSSPIIGHRKKNGRLKEKNLNIENKYVDMSEKGSLAMSQTKTKSRSSLLKEKTNCSDGSKSSNKINVSYKKPSEKENSPIWKKEKLPNSPLFTSNSKRKSLRLSKLKNQDIYEFIFEESKEIGPVKKKPKRKAFFRKKKKLKTAIKSGVLTTDPLWHPPIMPKYEIVANEFYKSSQPHSGQYVSRRKNSISTTGENDSLFQFEDDVTHNFDDIDEAGYEASISVATDNGSACFSRTSLPNHMYSLPTPKRNWSSKFPGTTSTPRFDNVEYNIFSKPTVENCFGFDESDDEKDVSGLSPVEKATKLPQLHVANITTGSNICEIEPVPSRFIPDCNITQSYNAKPAEKIKTSGSTYAKQKHAKNKEQSQFTSKVKKTLPNISNVVINKSVLFDEELDAENIAAVDDRFCTYDYLKASHSPFKYPVLNSKTNKITHRLDTLTTFSPEKSFTKPPKKSYNRESLEAVKQKSIIEMAGGYPTTDSDTEVEESAAVKKPSRKKIKNNKESKGTKIQSAKTYQPKKRTKQPQRSKENSKPSLGNRKNKSSPIIKKTDKKWDKSVTDWASDLNSHFSEIEDMDLVIE